MKPLTFMTVILGLILGFLFAANHRAEVASPPLRFLPPVPPPPPSPPVAVAAHPLDADAVVENDREEAEGLPVPIVPGTRVTVAKTQPPKGVEGVILGDTRRIGPDGRPIGSRNLIQPPTKEASRLPSTSRPVASRLMASVNRARADARLQLEREVTEWLTPEVPTHWKPPAPLISGMIRKGDVRPVKIDIGPASKQYGTVYEATLQADFSPERRDEFLAAYQREVVAHRLAILGGSLGFTLVCLASLAGYIRADEATKGYYTHWLRAIATAGVGASGVLLYQWLV